jgi:CHAT domain-containing protein/Flp pilus assembly protein TadD
MPSSRVCFFLMLAGVGSVLSGPTEPARLPKPAVAQDPSRVEQYKRLHRAAYDLLVTGKYVKAQELYQQVCQGVKALNDPEWTGRCLTSLGNCYFALFRYRKALDTYLEARQVAEAARDTANLGDLDVNISSLYFVMGDLEAAIGSAEEGLAHFNRQSFSGHRVRCLILLAVLRARQGRMHDAVQLAAEAIDTAYREGDLATVAEAWDHLGEEYLGRGELAAADRALTEAFRVRMVHHLNRLDYSYLNLGNLRLAEGDPASASRLLDRAVERQKQPESMETLWNIYHARGRAKMAQGRLEEAFSDFRKALDLARSWRLEVLPADFTRVSSEIQLQQLYSSFVEAGNRLYAVTGREALVRETFRAAEENRAASLRALLREPNDWRGALPARYWEALAQLHAAEVAMLSDEGAAVRAKMEGLRSKVLEFEAQAGSNGEIDSEKLVERTRKSLPSNAVLLSFHLGAGQSYMWALSRKQFQIYLLPGRTELAPRIARFSGAVRNGDGASAELGRELYQKLFGGLGQRLREKPVWILALDEELFQMPFAALVVESGSAGPVYLAERHAVSVTSGAVRLASGQPKSWSETLSGRFLGVGDAIYNTADPRWRKPAARAPSSLLPWVASAAAGGAPANTPSLARLAGSAREIEACARAWNPQPAALLEGGEVTADGLQKALRANPTVIHFATHFVPAKQPPRYAMIALSLSPAGNLQYWSPLEITRARIRTGVVVLSGCSSGEAEALPASGLMGLTRAWLAAGARAVVASHWSTPDDSGVLFANFYQQLREAPDGGPTMALRRAQLHMLHAGGWRSHPQYWATYFVAGDL